MYLSYNQIENIGATIIADFTQGKYEELVVPNIEEIATQKYDLKIKYRRLSENGNICGVTAYDDTSYTTSFFGEIFEIEVNKNEIILDDRFYGEDSKSKLYGKYRFTIAHELAHQILFALEGLGTKICFRKKYEQIRFRTVGHLKFVEDFNEWQANALASVLLMPKDIVDIFMWRINHSRKLTAYDHCFYEWDLKVMKMFCEHFGVSRTAAKIRLNQLGFIVQKKMFDYIDPYTILYEE